MTWWKVMIGRRGLEDFQQVSIPRTQQPPNLGVWARSFLLLVRCPLFTQSLFEFFLGCHESAGPSSEHDQCDAGWTSPILRRWPRSSKSLCTQPTWVPLFFRLVSSNSNYPMPLTFILNCIGNTTKISLKAYTARYDEFVGRTRQ